MILHHRIQGKPTHHGLGGADVIQTRCTAKRINGIFNGMESDTITTIDRAGRIVVPKALRRAGGLEPGTRLKIRLRDGIVEIEPAPRPVEIRRRGSIFVAEPVDEGAPLTAAEVQETLEATRRRDHRG